MSKAYAFSGHEGFIAAVAPRLSEAGFERVQDAAVADFVLTFCTSQTALEDAYFDEGGFVQMAHPGTVLIDCSTSTPNFARELNAVALVNELVPVEAPLALADTSLEEAFSRDNVMCFVAGEDAAVEAARPFVDVLAARVLEVGGPGAAQLARATYTLQMTSQVVAAIESDALFRQVQRTSVSAEQADGRVGAISPSIEATLAAVAAHRFEGAYTAEMLMAELSAALTAADDVDLIVPQAEAALHLLELLVVIGGADKAPAALALLYGEEALGAQEGLDWTRAEETYGERYEAEEDLFEVIEPDEEDYGEPVEGSSFPFGYSAN